MTMTQVVQGGLLALVVGLAAWAPLPAAAHCDTLDGPVVTDARAALEKGEVTPVLKWVRAEEAPAVTAAFTQTLAVRKLSPEAKALADTYFFETLVRLHRAGEGEPYTGLKPAGTTDPVVTMADAALAKGNADALVTAVTNHVTTGIRTRFARVLETRQHVNDSVPAGRAYVAAYVDYLHYVEGLHQAAQGAAPHGEAEAHEK
ncbi:MAG: DUF6448 family protein [Armatimonadota bacterium]